MYARACDHVRVCERSCTCDHAYFMLICTFIQARMFGRMYATEHTYLYVCVCIACVSVCVATPAGVGISADAKWHDRHQYFRCSAALQDRALSVYFGASPYPRRAPPSGTTRTRTLPCVSGDGGATLAVPTPPGWRGPQPPAWPRTDLEDLGSTQATCLPAGVPPQCQPSRKCRPPSQRSI